MGCTPLACRATTPGTSGSEPRTAAGLEAATQRRREGRLICWRTRRDPWASGRGGISVTEPATRQEVVDDPADRPRAADRARPGGVAVGARLPRRPRLDVLRQAPAWPARRGAEMTPQPSEHQLDTVVVGGGQAGLAMGYYLDRQHRDFVILDAAARVGDTWRNRWDSLKLFTPAFHSGLTGMPFPAPGSSFPTKDQTADYLEAYASRFRLPVRLGRRVQSLSRHDGGYLLH